MPHPARPADKQAELERELLLLGQELDRCSPKRELHSCGAGGGGAVDVDTRHVPSWQEVDRCGNGSGVVVGNADSTTHAPPKRRRLWGKQRPPAWWSSTSAVLPASLPSAGAPTAEQPASLDQTENALISLAAAAALQSAVEEAAAAALQSAVDEAAVGVLPSSNVLGSPVARRDTAATCSPSTPEPRVRENVLAGPRSPATSSPAAAASAAASSELVRTSPGLQAELEPTSPGCDASRVADARTCTVESSGGSVGREVAHCTQTSGSDALEASEIGAFAVELPIQQRSGSLSPSSGTNSDSDDDTSSSSSDGLHEEPQAAAIAATSRAGAGGCTEAVTRSQRTASPTSPASPSSSDSSSSEDQPLVSLSARAASPPMRAKHIGSSPAAARVASPAWARRRSAAPEPAEIEAAKRLSEVLVARVWDAVDHAEQLRLELVASQVARELWTQLRNPRPQLRTILWNLRDPQNPDFAQRVASGLTKASELPTLASEHMASSTKQAERSLLRERAVQESTLKRRLSGAMDPQALAAFRALASRR